MTLETAGWINSALIFNGKEDKLTFDVNEIVFLKHCRIFTIIHDKISHIMQVSSAMNEKLLIFYFDGSYYPLEDCSVDTEWWFLDKISVRLHLSTENHSLKMEIL